MPLYALLLLVYFCVICIVSVSLTVYDKYASIKRIRRIPEKTLLYFSFILGALPMYITMLFISHKTRHPKFMVGLPLLIILNAVMVYAYVYLVKTYA